MTAVNILSFGAGQASTAVTSQQTAGAVNETLQTTGQSTDGETSGQSLFSPMLLQMILAQQQPQQVPQLPALQLVQPDQVSAVEEGESPQKQVQPFTLFASADGVNELMTLDKQRTNISMESLKDGIQILDTISAAQANAAKEVKISPLSIELEIEKINLPVEKNEMPVETSLKTNSQKLPTAKSVSGSKLELDIEQLAIKPANGEKFAPRANVVERPTSPEIASVLQVKQGEAASAPKISSRKVEDKMNESKDIEFEVKLPVNGKAEKISKPMNDNEKTSSQSDQQSNGFSQSRQELQLKNSEVKESKQFIVQPVQAPSNGIGSTKETNQAHASTALLMKPETAQSVVDQVSKNILLALENTKSEMKVVLHPESLGQMTVRVQVEEGKVTTQVDVQQQQVKNVIEANLPQLRESLANKGLTVQRIDVFASELSYKEQASQQQQKKNHSGNGRTVQEREDIVESAKLFGYNTIEYVI